jgi:hypothetical protein
MPLHLLPGTRVLLTREEDGQSFPCDLDGNPVERGQEVPTFLDITGKRYALLTQSQPRRQHKNFDAFYSRTDKQWHPDAHERIGGNHHYVPHGFYVPSPDYTEHGIDPDGQVEAPAQRQPRPRPAPQRRARPRRVQSVRAGETARPVKRPRRVKKAEPKTEE